MNKTPIFYTSKQQEQLTDAIEENYGAGSGYIAHENKSEYVHTDILIVGNDGEEKTFATFGMSARAQKSTLPQFDNIELVMTASEDVNMMTDGFGVVCTELCNISKYPFANDTWLGMGHTIGASKKLKEKFGYEAYIVFGPLFSADVYDVGEVRFLQLVPIYNDEREWIMENGTFEYLEAYLQKFDELHIHIDQPRDHFIP